MGSAQGVPTGPQLGVTRFWFAITISGSTMMVVAAPDNRLPGSEVVVAGGVLRFPVSVAVTVPVDVNPETPTPPLPQCMEIAESVVFVWVAQVMDVGKPNPANVTGGSPCPEGRE